ncbi:LacI family DNA-binding transcriptional regulator [Alkalihalobacillus sp. TS-13]|uniref:LacI family DNA-binding transcriptional regulator n=1 Tax=Alkalihalobacillus sp. TS-13 TaxID=2842455 RepID=UPI001C879583|nr:LacI family DNA-binding transcriptional regulator [Alkalihalobacillus sp. TS-13]
MTTIKEIATRAQVSSATVSRVLNNDETLSVAIETRQKIIDVARALGYKTMQERRNEKAQPLTRQPFDNQDPKIAILLCHSLEEELNDAFFLSIRQGIEQELSENGMAATEIYRLSNMNFRNFRKDISNLIVVGRIGSDVLNELGNHLENIVYINHEVNENMYDSVNIDFEKATKSALNHLFDLGFKRIGFIGGQEREHLNGTKIEFPDGRAWTFEKVMKEKGLYDPQSHHVGDFFMSDGYKLMKKAINQGDLPEAFFIASDAMAIGAMRALQEKGYSIPKDIAIVSFNDVEMAKFASTPLTTVKVPTEEMGRTGVKLMLDRLKGRELPLKVTVPTELVIRDSCGAQEK